MTKTLLCIFALASCAGALTLAELADTRVTYVLSNTYRSPLTMFGATVGTNAVFVVDGSTDRSKYSHDIMRVFILTRQGKLSVVSSNSAAKPMLQSVVTNLHLPLGHGMLPAPEIDRSSPVPQAGRSTSTNMNWFTRIFYNKGTVRQRRQP